MINFVKIRNDLLVKKINLNDLGLLKQEFMNGYREITSMLTPDVKQIDSFIRLCLNYYVYNDEGDVLISDRDYDMVMNVWTQLGNPPIVYPDTITDYTTWPFIKHEVPGMVGTISKIYTHEELGKYLSKYNGITKYVIAPKYDGISACIKKKDNNIVYGITRADGYMGQDITAVVRSAKNAATFSESMNGSEYDGYFKCELCISQEDFNELIKEKRYANRRSAISGIVNSPKNLNLAKYITIIPLLYYNPKESYTVYKPRGYKKIKVYRTPDALEEIEKMLMDIRNSEYPYRTDGVVLIPDDERYKRIKINTTDFMENSIAYKVNTSEAPTQIEFGYMSVGRLGNAVPMLRVKPVEVNETIVTDASLCSYDKFACMNLHEDETVIVYSAGDVIPQIKIPEKRQYRAGAPYLKISKHCPYCEEKLERIGNEYKCTNSNCMRIITGRITNFLSKLSAENLSDGTIEALFQNKVLQNIKDLFSLTVDDIKELPGFDVVSASNIIKEIQRIKTSPIPVSTLFGALGIPNISEKKCRNIFNYITIDNILESSRKKIKHKILDADNVGIKTAKVFVDFIEDNRSLIRYLIKEMNIITDIKYKGNVVFTGFRNDGLKNQFRTIGFDIVDSVNSNTVAVVSASTDYSSTKCKAAIKKGISIVDLVDVNQLLKELRNW